MSQAWAVYDNARLDSRIGFLQEPAALEGHWRQYSQGGAFSHNLWNDAYLAAFAVAGNHELVTFDRGFARYPGLKHVILP